MTTIDDCVRRHAQTFEQWEIEDWVFKLAPWDVWFTGTFKWPVYRVDVASGITERFMAKHLPARPCFYAVEWHPGGHGCHVHALIASSGACYRSGLWRAWFGRYGRARVESVRHADQESSYCAKYCVKHAFAKGWWNALNCVQAVFPGGGRCWTPRSKNKRLQGASPCAASEYGLPS